MKNEQILQVIRDQAPAGFLRTGSVTAIKRRITTIQLIEDAAQSAREALEAALDDREEANQEKTS